MVGRLLLGFVVITISCSSQSVDSLRIKHFKIGNSDESSDSLKIIHLLQGNWGRDKAVEFVIKNDSILYPESKNELFSEPAKHYKFHISRKPIDSLSYTPLGIGYYLIQVSAKDTLCDAIDKLTETTLALRHQRDVVLY